MSGAQRAAVGLQRSIYGLVRTLGWLGIDRILECQMLKARKNSGGPDPAIEYGLIGVLIVVAVAIAIATISGYIR
jgi:DMSO/TMAO reductase YedYZ heme-binding membrane subunit